MAPGIKPAGVRLPLRKPGGGAAVAPAPLATVLQAQARHAGVQQLPNSLHRRRRGALLRSTPPDQSRAHAAASIRPLCCACGAMNNVPCMQHISNAPCEGCASAAAPVRARRRPAAGRIAWRHLPPRGSAPPGCLLPHQRWTQHPAADLLAADLRSAPLSLALCCGGGCPDQGRQRCGCPSPCCGAFLRQRARQQPCGGPPQRLTRQTARPTW